jgi:hypothetical protein
MYPLISSLFVLPLVISGLLLVLPKFLFRIFVIITAIILSSVSICLFISIPAPIHLQLPLYLNQVVAAADILLLLFFAQIAIQRKKLWVGLLTVAQLAATIYLIKSNSLESSFQLVIDKLSCFMFLLINIISGIIAVFSFSLPLLVFSPTTQTPSSLLGSDVRRNNYFCILTNIAKS